jgi:cobalt-zinc-cadmium efflux system membrane fusion protein
MELIRNQQTIFFALAMAIFACQSKTGQGGENPVSETHISEINLSTAQIKNAGIVLQAPVIQPISLDIPVSGVLDVPPQNLHSIGARVPGMVKSTSLLQGAHVHKGDVLTILENPEFLNWQQEYMSGKARLEMLESDLQRQEGLAEKNLSSQKTLQQIQSECKMMRASLSASRQKLQVNGFSLNEIEKGNFSAELPLRAPADGFITAVYINTGQVLKEGDPICELVNMEHIHAELMVFEKDVAHIREGQEVNFELVSDPGRIHQAKVFLVNRKIGKERTVQVHAHLEEHRPEFLPNMQITAHIRSDERPEWTIPEEALVYEGNQPVVFISGDKPGSFRKLHLQVLVKEGRNIAVKFPPDQNPGEIRLVVKGAYDVKSAMEKASSGGEEGH